MQVELSLLDLQALKSWGEVVNGDDTVLSIIEDAIEQAQELQALDLNDCGDACKL